MYVEKYEIKKIIKIKISVQSLVIVYHCVFMYS